MGDRRDVDLAELERLEKAATPGPWYTTGQPWYRTGDGVLAGSPDGNVAFMIADCEAIGQSRDEYEGPFELATGEDDAVLIAAARNALPSLIVKAREVEELRKRNLEVAMLAHKWMAAHDMLKAGEPYKTPAVADVPESEMRAEMAEINLAHYVAECKGLRRQVEYTEERRQYWHHEACKENARADALAVRLAEAETRIATLVEALEPFAEEWNDNWCAEQNAGHEVSDDEYLAAGGCSDLQAGDLRRVAKALAPAPNGKKGADHG